MPDINQDDITEQLNLFLLSIDEKMPSWMIDENGELSGLCNAFKIMGFRAGLIKQENLYFKRLQKLAAMDNEEIRQMGELYLRYKTLFTKLSQAHQKELTKKIAECKNNKAEIEKTRSTHYEIIINAAIKEAAANTHEENLIKQANDLYSFISSLLFSDNPGVNYHFQPSGENVSQEAVKEMFKIIGPDQLDTEQKNNPLSNLYSFAFTFKGRSNELEDVVKLLVKENDHAILFSSDHAMYLTARKNSNNAIEYVLYDPNEDIPPTPLSLSNLITKIRYHFFIQFNDPDTFMPLGLKVYSSQKDESKPSPAELCKQLILNREKQSTVYKKDMTLEERAEALDLNKQGFDGSTALSIAVNDGEIDVVNQLIREGVNIHIAHRYGTPLSRAIRFGYAAIVKTLIQHGGRVEATHILEASQQGNEEVIDILLKEFEAKKIDWYQITDSAGNTPIMLAASRHHYTAVERLIASKANANRPNKNGETPLKVAQYNKDSKMIDILTKTDTVLNKNNKTLQRQFRETNKTTKADFIKLKNLNLSETQKEIINKFLSQKENSTLTETQEISLKKFKSWLRAYPKEAKKLLDLLRNVKSKPEILSKKEDLSILEKRVDYDIKAVTSKRGDFINEIAKSHTVPMRKTDVIQLAKSLTTKDQVTLLLRQFLETPDIKKLSDETLIPFKRFIDYINSPESLKTIVADKSFLNLTATSPSFEALRKFRTGIVKEKKLNLSDTEKTSLSAKPETLPKIKKIKQTHARISESDFIYVTPHQLALNKDVRNQFYKEHPHIIQLLKRDPNNKTDELAMTHEAMALLVEKKIIQHKLIAGEKPYNIKNTYVIKNENNDLIQILSAIELKNSEDIKLIYMDGMNATPIYLRNENGKIKCLILGEPSESVTKAITNQYPNALLFYAKQNHHYDSAIFSIESLIYFSQHGNNIFTQLEKGNSDTELKNLVLKITNTTTDQKNLGLHSIREKYHYFLEIEQHIHSLIGDERISQDSRVPLPVSLDKIYKRLSMPIKSNTKININSSLKIAKKDNYINQCKKIIDHIDNKTKLDDLAFTILNAASAKFGSINNIIQTVEPPKPTEHFFGYGQFYVYGHADRSYTVDQKNTEQVKLYKFLCIALCKESENLEEMKKCAITYAKKLLSLFGTYEKSLEYLNKQVREKAQQPIHDACLFELPTSDNWDKKKWAALVILHGKKASDYLRLAPDLDKKFKELRTVDLDIKKINTTLTARIHDLKPSPHDRGKIDAKTQDIKSLRDDKDSSPAIKHTAELADEPIDLPDINLIKTTALTISYVNAEQHPVLAALCLKFRKNQQTFDKCLELYKTGQFKHFDLLPDIQFELNHEQSTYTIKKLPADDYRGLFLGEYTACCQSIGSAGEVCAIRGMTSPYAGFYVVLDNRKRIIAQTWAWMGKKGELVFDSWEYVNKKGQTHLCKLFLEKTKETMFNHGFTSIAIGGGGNTPKDLNLKPVKELIHQRGYDGYSDARFSQMLVAKAPSHEVLPRFKHYISTKKLSLESWITNSKSINNAIDKLVKTNKPNLHLVEEFFLFLYRSGYHALHELAVKQDYIHLNGLLSHLDQHALRFLLLTDNDENTVLHLAALTKAEGCIKHLVDHLKKTHSSQEISRILHIKNLKQQTLLTICIENNSENILKTFSPFFNQETFTIADSKGNTALHLAAERGTTNLFEQMLIWLNLKSDALMNILKIKNHDGMSILHLAANANNVTVLQILRKYLSDQEMQQLYAITTNTAYSPVDIAVLNNHQEFSADIFKQAKDPEVRLTLFKTQVNRCLNPRLIAEEMFKYYQENPAILKELFSTKNPYSTTCFLSEVGKSDLKTLEKSLSIFSKHPNLFNELLNSIFFINDVVDNRHNRNDSDTKPTNHFEPIVSIFFKYMNLDQKKKALLGNDKYRTLLSQIIYIATQKCLEDYLQFLDSVCTSDAKTPDPFRTKVLTDIGNEKDPLGSPLIWSITQLGHLREPLTIKKTEIVFNYYEKHLDKASILKLLLHYKNILETTIYISNYTAFQRIFNIFKTDETFFKSITNNLGDILSRAVQKNEKEIVNFLLNQKPSVITKAHLAQAFSLQINREQGQNGDYRDIEMFKLIGNLCKAQMSKQELHDLIKSKDKDGRNILQNLIYQPFSGDYEKRKTHYIEIAHSLIDDFADDKNFAMELIASPTLNGDNLLHQRLEPRQIRMIACLCDEKTIDSMLTSRNQLGLTPQMTYLVQVEQYRRMSSASLLEQSLNAIKIHKKLSALHQIITDPKWDKQAGFFTKTVPEDIQKLRDQLYYHFPKNLAPTDDKFWAVADSLFHSINEILSEKNARFPKLSWDEQVSAYTKEFKKFK